MNNIISNTVFLSILGNNLNHPVSQTTENNLTDHNITGKNTYSAF